jgi:serine acetyltransferase
VVGRITIGDDAGIALRAFVDFDVAPVASLSAIEAELSRWESPIIL